MATKAMSEMTDEELIRERDGTLAYADSILNEQLSTLFIILANQYDAALTMREKDKA